MGGLSWGRITARSGVTRGEANFPVMGALGRSQPTACCLPLCAEPVP